MTDLTNQVTEAAFEDICLSADEIEIRKINLNDLADSLRAGYKDFGVKPSSIPFLMLYYVLFAVLFTIFSFGQELRYLIFPVVAGFTLFGPIVAIGYFEMSRSREKGLNLSWRASFGFIHSSSFAPILALSLIMMLLYVGWLYMAQVIYFGLFTDNPPESMSDFINQVLTTRRGGALIVYGNLVGFLFAFAAMAISVVAFPLALDKPVTSLTAMSVSIKAFTANAYVLAVWGAIVVALMALGTTVFLIGLALVLPVLGHATWHLYRKIVVA